MSRKRRRTTKTRRATDPVNDESPTPTRRIGLIAAVCQIVSAAAKLWHDLTS